VREGCISFASGHRKLCDVETAQLPHSFVVALENPARLPKYSAPARAGVRAARCDAGRQPDNDRRSARGRAIDGNLSVCASVSRFAVGTLEIGAARLRREEGREVVDDEALIRCSLSEVLRRHGHTVVEATSASTAREVLDDVRRRLPRADSADSG
jgi:hypothetical protein